MGRLLLNGILSLFFTVGWAAPASESVTPPTCSPGSQLNQNKVSLDGLFGVLQVNPSSLTGAGFQIGLNSGISDVWGLGLVLGRTWTYSSTTLFTQVSLEASRALTGRSVQDSASPDFSGLMLHAFIHRIFVSTSSSDVGYFGVGSALSYEFPISEKDSFRLGGRADYSFKSDFSFFTLQLFSGLSHRF